MKALLVILVLAAPAYADRTPTLSLGLGVAKHDGALQGLADHYSVGARIGERDWLAASFDYLRLPLSDDSLWGEERLWEVAIAATRMSCKPSSRVCGVYGFGAGYQSAGYEHSDDGFEAVDPIVLDRANVFGEGRLAGRLVFDYVWLELSFAARLHVQLGRDDDPNDEAGMLNGGYVLGLALYATP